MKSILILAVAVVLTIPLAACARRETTTTQTSAQRDSIAAAESRLERIRNEIDSLDVKARNLGDQAKTEILEEIHGLTVARDSAAAELARLKMASAEAWESTKEATDRSLGALEEAIAGARERIHSRADTVVVGGGTR